ncbi:hypothetical protein ACS0TY_020325 [Phlomoides rotata]
MGRISSSEPPPQKETTTTTTTHFSHPHPLKLINHNQSLNPSPSCSGCNLKPSGLIYSCTLCNFILHDKCFGMPKTISHPFHKEHPFTLLPTPAYDQGLFNCDACGENGDGFSYHCKPCGIDLHILCAATPLTLTTVHHPHKLDLTFCSPYDTKNFACDVCKLQGSDHWLYRCGPCGFDAHLKCARAAPPPQQAATYSRYTPPVSQPQVHGVPYFSAAAPPPPMQQGFAFAPQNMNPAVGFPAMTPPGLGVNRGQNEMFHQALAQIVQNQNAMTQAVMAGGGGGVAGGFSSGYGGNNRVQQMMHLMSSVNGSGGGLNALGGGGGGQVLQALTGGGGGGQVLQALMGGGGGLESLQSLLSGGGGLDFLGDSGLDLLGGLGDVFF